MRQLRFALSSCSIFLSLLVFLICAHAHAEVPDFRLLDQSGRSHALSYYSDKKAIVIVSFDSTCSQMANILLALKALHDEIGSLDVQYFYLNSGTPVERGIIDAFVSSSAINIPVLLDTTQFVAHSLNITAVPEVVVINPRYSTIVYREKGTINGLGSALKSVLSEQPIQVKNDQPSSAHAGCAISYEPLPRQLLSYSRGVAPILRNRCATCHKQGGIAPWAMLNYESVRGWAPMMREVLLTKRMPPWDADPAYGIWADDLSLTHDELRAVLTWIDGGALRDEGVDPLIAGQPVVPEWNLGPPDLIVEIPAQDIPATGLIDYRYLRVDLPNAEERWVRAYQLRSSSPQVVHHAFSFISETDSPDDARRWSSKGFFAAASAYSDTQVLPDDTGLRLPSHAKMWFQLHFVSRGRPERNLMKLGLYFASKAPKHELKMDSAVNMSFVIAPNNPESPVEATLALSQPTTVYGFLPHMHYRGTRIKIDALYPDGAQETLLSVPWYRLDWQRWYRLKSPKSLPAGTVLRCNGTFDNSRQNRFNPDPNKEVRFGESALDEMFICYVSFTEG